MALVWNEKRTHEHRCDGCQRVLGNLSTGLIDAGAGYVTKVGRWVPGVTVCASDGCGPRYEHPLACSDACEDKLLASWPRMKAEDVYAEDWGPDFRDADVIAPSG